MISFTANSWYYYRFIVIKVHKSPINPYFLLFYFFNSGIHQKEIFTFLVLSL